MHHSNTAGGLGRRQILLNTAGVFSLFGLGGALQKSAVAASSATTVLLTPQEEQGPFFVDGQLERKDVLYDTSTGTVQSGLHLFLKITINQVASGASTPLSGVRVDIWEANADGLYSDEASQDTSSENYLRGYQISDSNGVVEFLTIYPGWYSGRTPHIHALLRLYSGTTLTYKFETQFFFPDSLTAEVYKLEPYAARASGQNTFNTNDRVFNYTDCTTGATSGDEMFLTIVRANSSYMIAEYTMELDLTAPAPTCIGVSDGGINEGGGGGGTPPTSAGIALLKRSCKVG